VQATRSAVHALGLIAVASAACWLWTIHAPGGRSAALGYEAAQYAVAARELAEHGRLATPFALPIELALHAQPPWPLAVVQPGLVVVEAAFQRLAPRAVAREGLGLIVPFVCFLAIGVAIAWLVSSLLARYAAGTTPLERSAAAVVAGLAFLLDPEAQHLAAGGFTELPFALGLLTSIGAIASGWAPRRPLLFGLLLGVAETFRSDMLWLAPLLALAAATSATGGAGNRVRLRVFMLALLGYALPLAPWWYYKWRAFGSPAWDLSRYMLWEGTLGRSWFVLLHLPQQPALPEGVEAVRLLVAKLGRNLPGLLLALTAGPRALWIGALLAWLLVARPARALAVTGAAVLAQAALGLVAAAFTLPWPLALFPARVPLEVSGLLAVWGLVGSLEPGAMRPGAVRALRVAVALLALGWGGFQTVRGNAAARTVAAARDLPDVATLNDLGQRLDRELAAGEPVMSNLGPTLAWYAKRPVLHLALTPADVEGCRDRLALRHVVLAFRGSAQGWSGWAEVLARPQDAAARTEWNVLHERHWRSQDGFLIVWLELGAPIPQLAGGSRSEPRVAAASGG